MNCLIERENGTYYEPSTTRVYQLTTRGNYIALATLRDDTLMNEPIKESLEEILTRSREWIQ